MITNDKQYNSTRRTVEELRTSLAQIRSANSDIHPMLVDAHRSALQSQIDEMEGEIAEFERLRSGALKIFEAEDLEEVPNLLIRARIARAMSQKDLAEYIGLKEQQIQRYEADRYQTASFERIVEIAKALDVKIRETAEIKGDYHLSQSYTKPAEAFPLAEMLKRGWFEGFHGKLSDARKNAHELLSDFFARAHSDFATPALHRKSVRSSGHIHEAAISAWEAWILIQADKQQPQQKFHAELISYEWIQQLRHLTRYDDGPKRAVGHLRDIGIIFVLEPHLPGTLLDGAAIRTEGGAPIVAITCRYDRLDNFWFTLCHEIGHIVMHIYGENYKSIFDNMDDPARTEIEVQADSYAREMLLPDDIWHKAVSRFSRTEQSVIRDAERFEVGPAIIAGRIRREANNYTLLRSLVGSGAVRRQFHDK